MPDLGSPLELRLSVGSAEDIHVDLTERSGLLSASGTAPSVAVREAQTAWTAARAHWTGEQAPIRQIGEALAGVLPRSVMVAFQAAIGIGLTEGRPIRVVVDCENQHLREAPWEWLFLRKVGRFDPAEGPLAMVPNVRVWRESGNASTLKEGELRVLVVVADPGSSLFPRLPWLSTEARSIASAFAQSRRQGVELRTMLNALPTAVEKMIAEFKPHLFHFSGHGALRPEGGILVMNGPRPHSDRLLPANRLVDWLVSAGTQVAFLSACDTAGADDSVARALIAGGVPTVVAMQTPIPDAAQPHRARVFYGALLDGAGIDEALAEARQASGPASTGWSSVVLYASGTPFALGAPRGDQGVRFPNNLPHLQTPIVGRDREIHEILRISEDSRLIVLTGSAGIGKTRLAFEAAVLKRDDYPGGTWVVECESCASAEDVLFAVSRTLEIGLDERSLATRVAERLASQRTLLVLDGLEGVVASGDQAVVEHLLTDTSATLLVTSRFRLGVPDEAALEIAPLHGGGGHGRELLVQAAGFVGRRLSDEDERGLTEICRTLEGVPLALIIAAGRLRFLQIAQLAQLLRESPLSTLGGRVAGVSATIRRSLALVSAEDRRLLQDLAVFAGAYSWEDVAEVYADERFAMLDGLARLVDRSLLRAENLGARKRFRAFDSLREYLAALPETEEEQNRTRRGRERHLGLFARRAKTIAELLNEGRWVEGTDALWDALPNLRAALDFAIQSQRSDEAETLCRSLSRTLMEAGMWHDFERVAALAHLVAREANRPYLASHILGLEGAMRSRLGDHAGAEQMWRRRIELCRSMHNDVAASDALLDLAAQAVETGKLPEAHRWIEEATEEVAKTDRNDLRVILATVRCRYFDAVGDFPRACAYAYEAETLLGPESSADEALFVYTNLARVWRQRDDHRRVRRAMERILRDAVAGERRTQAAAALTELANTHREEGDAHASLKCLSVAVTILRELGSHRLKQVQRRYQEYREATHDFSEDTVFSGSWSEQVGFILDHLSALDSEDR